MEKDMREVVSLLIVFVVAAVLYEYMKPKNDSSSTGMKKDLNDDED